MSLGQEHIPVQRGGDLVPLAVLPAFQRVVDRAEVLPSLGIAGDSRYCARQVNEDRLYRGLDQLLPHKKAIEQHLRQRLGELFDLSFDILLYDLTSTYFEGQCAANPMARRGYSRQPVGLLQVVIALIVTVEGYPLGMKCLMQYRRLHDGTEDRREGGAEHGRSQRIWVMDRAQRVGSQSGVHPQRGGQYIVGTPKRCCVRCRVS